MKETIKNIDILGYPVSLNFDWRGSSFQTVFGGTMSVFYFGFILYYAGLGIFKIKFHLQDTDLSYSSTLNLG
jgi:hypothetical protein